VKPRRQLAAACVFSLGFAFVAQAQEAAIRTSQAPYFVGVPIDIQVVTQGFEETPEPEIEAPIVTGAKLRFVGMSPSRMESIRIIGGKRSSWIQVQHVYQYQLTPTQPGPLQAGRFTVRQGPTRAATRALTLPVSTVPTSGDYRLIITLPSSPVWIGQRVPVTVAWWLPEDRAERVQNRRAQVPLFDRLDAFKFEDPPPPGNRAPRLVFDTDSGPLTLRGEVKRSTDQGRGFLVVQFTRMMTPLKVGQFQLAPSTLVVEETIQFSRNLFGERVPARVRRVQAASPGQTLIVRAAPLMNRPPSYSGAVGTGFSLEVSADRTVVQAGDPITLTLVIRGDTALESIALPPLASAGLDPGAFRVPEGNVPGNIEGTEQGLKSKRFRVPVRVLHDGVREIPPLKLTWFDPKAGQYQTTHSRPIALSVRRAEVVSAADVVRSEALVARADDSTNRPPPQTAKSSHDQVPAEFILRDAELAIVTDVDRLLAPDASPVARWPAQAVAYLLSLLFICTAIYQRRRSAIDPSLGASIAAARHHIAALEQGSTRELSDALRALRQLSTTDPVVTAHLDEVIRACDEVSFAPGSGEVPPAGGLRARAVSAGKAVRRVLEAQR